MKNSQQKGGKHNLSIKEISKNFTIFAPKLNTTIRFDYITQIQGIIFLKSPSKGTRFIYQ